MERIYTTPEFNETIHLLKFERNIKPRDLVNGMNTLLHAYMNGNMEMNGRVRQFILTNGHSIHPYQRDRSAKLLVRLMRKGGENVKREAVDMLNSICENLSFKRAELNRIAEDMAVHDAKLRLLMDRSIAKMQTKK